IDGIRVTADGEVIEDDAHDEEGNPISDLAPQQEAEGDAGQPLTDLLTRDLTAHRTLGLRLALGEQPDIALIAVTNTLAAQTFYRGVDAHALEIRPGSVPLGGHADGIEDMAAAKMLAHRHGWWAADMPRDVGELWDFIAGLDHVSIMALFAHCASLTVNALKLPWEQRPRALRTADKLARALALDMNQHWTPTARTYFGRVTKAHIMAAVREVVGDEAADRIATMKKQPMAEAAEPLLVGTGWLPPLLRTAWPGSTLAPEGSNGSRAAFGTDEPDTDLGEINLPDAAE
ncbi:MAG: chromosome partitioning protein ParB, partial [Hyphomicrobiales bacterium]